MILLIYTIFVLNILIIMLWLVNYSSQLIPDRRHLTPQSKRREGQWDHRPFRIFRTLFLGLSPMGIVDKRRKSGYIQACDIL